MNGELFLCEGDEGKSVMNASELIELMNRSPFQPLEIHLNDGSIIIVNEPFEIATQRTSPRFIVYTTDKMDVVSYRNVAKVTTPVAARDTGRIGCLRPFAMGKSTQEFGSSYGY